MNKSSKPDSKDNMEWYFQKLQDMPELEPPPFLLTRIKARIARLADERISPRLALPSLATLCLILVINGVLIAYSTNKLTIKQPPRQSYLLPTDNTFYK